MKKADDTAASAPGVPVLKMPPELALPALRILADERDPEKRKVQLSALRTNIPSRTLLNAYVLPSLTTLKLFEGTLRAGSVSRFGRAIAKARTEEEAQRLMARHLIEVDSAQVGLVDWLAARSVHGERKGVALKRFLSQTTRPSEDPPTLDRLGKWANFLVFFGVIREHHTDGNVAWAVSRRHVAGLLSDAKSKKKLSDDFKADALLDAYTQASEQLGMRLYLPITLVRDVLGDVLAGRGVEGMSDGQLDDILRDAPTLLDEHLVTFSPFSGPSRGGLKLDRMYAGFISIRPKASRSMGASG